MNMFTKSTTKQFSNLEVQDPQVPEFQSYQKTLKQENLYLLCVLLFSFFGLVYVLNAKAAGTDPMQPTYKMEKLAEGSIVVRN